MLARDGVHAFPVAAFGGLNLQPHLLAKGSGKKTAHGVGLPAGGFHQFGQGRAFRFFQEGDDTSALAALVGCGSFCPGLAFRRLLAPTGLCGRLGLRVRGRRLSGRSARFIQFCRLGHSSCGLILFLRSHEFQSSFGGSDRVTTFMALIDRKIKQNLKPLQISPEKAEGTAMGGVQSPRINLARHARWWSQRGSRAIFRKFGSVRKPVLSAERNRTYSWMAGARCSNIMI